MFDIVTLFVFISSVPFVTLAFTVQFSLIVNVVSIPVYLVQFPLSICISFTPFSLPFGQVIVNVTSLFVQFVVLGVIFILSDTTFVTTIVASDIVPSDSTTLNT